MSGIRKVVCVTGASGFIGSWVVKLLLQRGYTVKATVLGPDDPKETEHLLSLDGAKERLDLFKADLLEEGSFDHAVDGCEGVFHLACPIILMSVTDPQAELIDPALKGTLNVLRSCAKVPTIKRVVFTSSIVAVLFTGKPLSPDVVIDESWFSDPGLCEKSKLWYALAKTLAEEAAWKFAKENSIDLVAIHPGKAIGPLLQPTLNSSSKPLLKLINGTEKFPNITYRWVDVRDVANAHILALENPSASGRYFMVERVSHCSEAMKIVRDLFSDLNLPEQCEDDQPFALAYEIPRQRALSLGVEFTPLEVTLKDAVESLKEKKFF